MKWFTSLNWHLKRLLCYVGCTTVTIGFIKEAASKTLSYEDYLAYATSMVIFYSPQLAIHIMEELRKLRGGIM